MSHPLVLALFPTRDDAARAARALHDLGVAPEELSIVSRDHMDAGTLAQAFDGTPGADLEDSRFAARLGELSAYALTAISVVLPGVGSVLAAGPFAAELGEAAGHMAGGLPSVLGGAGIDPARAEQWQAQVEQGAVLLGVHALRVDAAAIEDTLRAQAPADFERTSWSGGA